jgi:hypothetical protein
MFGHILCTLCDQAEGIQGKRSSTRHLLLDAMNHQPWLQTDEPSQGIAFACHLLLFEGAGTRTRASAELG